MSCNLERGELKAISSRVRPSLARTPFYPSTERISRIQSTLTPRKIHSVVGQDLSTDRKRVDGSVLRRSDDLSEHSGHAAKKFELGTKSQRGVRDQIWDRSAWPMNRNGKQKCEGAKLSISRHARTTILSKALSPRIGWGGQIRSRANEAAD
jgi:hypothetical protein